MNIYEKYLTGTQPDELNETDEYLSDLMEMVFEFIDTIDMDNLSEEQDELLEQILDMYDSDEELSEVKKERVVRAGKRVRKVTCPEGKKAVNGKCVRMSASEKRTRSKSAKKGARKAKSKRAATTRKRAKSMKKRI